MAHRGRYWQDEEARRHTKALLDTLSGGIEREFTSNLRHTISDWGMVFQFAYVGRSAPSMLQDIIFITVVVVAFVALFRLSERVAKWFEKRSEKQSLHNGRRDGVDDKKRLEKR